LVHAATKSFTNFRYVRAAGWPVDLAALAFYRIRWALNDVSAFVR
jgi:hypothetical protein